MAKVVAKPPTLQVAKPIAATLYIVLDPAKVKQAYHVSSERRKMTLDISQFDLFVSRDLKQTMTPFFERVEVVSPGAAMTGKHLVADVKIEHVELKDEAVEGAVQMIATPAPHDLGLRCSTRRSRRLSVLVRWTRDQQPYLERDGRLRPSNRGVRDLWASREVERGQRPLETAGVVTRHRSARRRLRSAGETALAQAMNAGQ
jgi:hypothetical protein